MDLNLIINETSPSLTQALALGQSIMAITFFIIKQNSQL